MKFLNLGFWLLMMFSFSLVSCDDSDDEEELVGNWIKMGAFEGIPRTGAVSFVIDGNAYVGLGYNGKEDIRLRDFWMYDPVNDYWSQVDSFPGVDRNGAVAFSVNGKGYVGTGDEGEDPVKDFYEYDPTEDKWTRIADFGGSAREGAIAFAIDGYGYVGTGYDINGYIKKDFWRYDPTLNKWEQIPSIGGSKRTDAVAFVIANKAYVCSGLDNASYLTDFWEYDPVTNEWDELRSIANLSDDSFDDDYSIVGIHATAFSVGSLGYITTGGPGTVGNETWEYNPVTDTWCERTEFEGNARFNAVSFVINDIPYVTSGNSSGYYFDDVWTFESTVEQEDDDNY
ncbi:MAG: galactose oxidase [Marinilabiliaceae bacterium]|nr:galactose oxidase [Marinilabiliaceae bacterium]